MKKILIVNNNMHIGGVQKALLNLLKEISGDYEVTLLLFFCGGQLLEKIPDNVKVIACSSLFKYWGITKNDAVSLKQRIVRAFLAAITRIFGRKWTLRIQYPFQKKLSGYDVAISFLHSGDVHTFYGGCNEFVLNCVDAPKKITFLHCDYGKINGNSKYNAELYEKFDLIAACSDGCRQAFLQVMPQLSDKTVVVQNCHDYSDIRYLAKKEPAVLTSDKLNVVTVARFGKEKGILREISAIAALGEKAHGLHCCIIGNGIDYPEAEHMISELGLENTVFLLGERENPYGYMKAADVLLIPSVSEAAPMVIGEAASLGTPILTTQTSSAYEMVAQTGFGWVCDNSEAGIKTGIEALLSEPELVENKKAYLQSVRFDNALALDQFSGLIC